MINYYLITKPGIIFGNLVTVAAGFILASKGVIDYKLFLATLLGLGLIIASACVFNNYIDRKIDKKMQRTKNRPLANGTISVFQAMLFACLLCVAGMGTLYYYTNLLTVCVASLGFFVYVILYSFWKVKTIYGTAIGSIAGAVPPVVGYCAVSNQFDAGAIILFTMLVFWQMPHFFAIAMLHFDDYAAADVPVLPVKKGMLRTKVHMVLYITAFICTTALLTLFGYTGNLFFYVTLALGLAWLALGFKGFNITDDRKWGKQMFQLSLVMIMVLCGLIPFDSVSG